MWCPSKSRVMLNLDCSTPGVKITLFQLPKAQWYTRTHKNLCSPHTCCSVELSSFWDKQSVTSIVHTWWRKKVSTHITYANDNCWPHCLKQVICLNPNPGTWISTPPLEGRNAVTWQNLWLQERVKKGKHCSLCQEAYRTSSVKRIIKV